MPRLLIGLFASLLLVLPARAQETPPAPLHTAEQSDAPALRTPAQIRRALLTPDAAETTQAGARPTAGAAFEGNRTWLYAAGGAVLVAGGVLAAVLLTGSDGGNGGDDGFPTPPDRPE